MVGWTEDINPGCAGTRTTAIIASDSPYSNVLQVKSVGAGGCGGINGLYRDLSLNTADYNQIFLKASVKAISATTGGGCGWAGWEYPLQITLYYLTSSNEQKTIDFLFHYGGGSCGNPDPWSGRIPVSVQVPQNTWYGFLSGDIKSIAPDAVKITGIFVGGGGWDYEGRADNIDFLFEPTLITLSSFTASSAKGKVTLKWETETEIDNIGFNILRSESEDGGYVKINKKLIPAKMNATLGATYKFVDDKVKPGKTYFYKLEDIDRDGVSTLHGPKAVTVSFKKKGKR